MRYWDFVSPVYDLQLALERPAIETALDLAQTLPTEHLLDLATGTGVVLRALAKREPRPDHALGVDVSARMLGRVPPLPAGWRIMRADVQALPFRDARFDVATCSYLLHLLAPRERARVLTETRRVLAPGGRLVTVTPVAPPTAVGRLARAIVGRYLHDPRADLEKAGFRIRGARYVPAGYPSLCVLAAREGVR